MKTEYNADLTNLADSASSQRATQEYPTSLKDGDVRRTLAKKVCKNCEELKSLDEFYFNKTKDSWFSECKVCNKLRSTRWNKKNSSRYKENCKRHKENNPELYKVYKKTDYRRNIETYKNSGKVYRQSKHGRGVRLALGRERELRKLKATPTWLSDAQRQEMKQLYINRPPGYHVDHIVPLKGRLVCGLHVPWNLQYLPAAENIRKRNKT